VATSFLAGLPRHRLGPVAASSYRVASRIVNGMRAGHAVRDADELASCRTILVAVQEKALPAAVGQLEGAAIEWRGKVVLLCRPGLVSHVLNGLRTRGAEAASVQPIAGPGKRFALEGDRLAMRAARDLVRELGGRPFEFASDRMAVYGAGLSFATSLFTPLIAACAECLGEAGKDTAAATRIVETLFQKSLREYAHAGRKSWAGPVAEGDCAAVRRQIDALTRHNPLLARFYRQAAGFALEYFRKHPDLRKSVAGA
jgi:predicted short-subunit dehydrogenase-like oxidoreductase (DUF2520 family)